MRFTCIFLFFGLLSTASIKAQHLQLINDKGELGGFMGYSSYTGDVASDVQFVKMNYGAFYKKQFNSYIGLRASYEKINLGASDFSSKNPYELARGFFFERDFHEISLLSELYFNRFITDRKNFRFSPYLGFGAGYLMSANLDRNNFSIKTNTRYTSLMTNIGFKWNIYKQISLFSEFKYRFNLSDYIDHFSDATAIAPQGSVYKYQGSKSGKDQMMSASLGLSYNFRKIYGPEIFKQPKRKKNDIEDHSPQKKSKLLFSLPFNRK